LGLSLSLPLPLAEYDSGFCFFCLGSSYSSTTSVTVALKGFVLAGGVPAFETTCERFEPVYGYI